MRRATRLRLVARLTMFPPIGGCLSTSIGDVNADWIVYGYLFSTGFRSRDLIRTLKTELEKLGHTVFILRRQMRM